MTSTANPVARELLRALAATSTAFQAVETVTGSLGPFGDSVIGEIRNDLAWMIRRLNNVALLNGVSPAAVEQARQLHGGET